MSNVDPAAAAPICRLIRRSRLYRDVRAVLADWIAERAERKRVIAACSGGPDSTALLLALWALREPLQLTVHVVCVDHQLRAEAGTEAAQVCAVAARLGLSAERVPVVCPPGSSKMAAARTARYAALAAAAGRQGAAAVLVAHTQQDQTETMLMRWLAGAGLLGLCGMAARRELPAPGWPDAVTLLRPLLTTPRAEVDALLGRAAALVAPLPVHDPSNLDRHYQRSRLRHDLLPLLRREQPQLDVRLARLAVQLRDDADYLEQQAAAAYAALAGPAGAPTGPVTLPLAATVALPPALFARVMMRASGGGLEQVHIAALAGLCAHGHGSRSLDLPGGRRVERRYAELRFFTPATLGSPQTEQAAQTLPSGGEYPLAQGTLTLTWETPTSLLDPEITQCAPVAAPASAPGRAAAGAGSEARLTLPEGAFPLTLRGPRPGDRIRLTGRGGQRKLSDLLIDLKVPRSERPGVLLLCWGEQILWVIGHRLAAPPTAAPPLGPPRVLRARFVPSR